MLILVGNHRGATKGKATMRLPFEKVERVLDIREGRDRPASPELKVDVPAGTIALFYVKGTKGLIERESARTPGNGRRRRP